MSANTSERGFGRRSYTAADVEGELRRIAAEPPGVVLERVQRQATLVLRMAEGDRAVLLRATADIANTVPKAGPRIAFEILGAVAIASARRDGDNGGDARVIAGAAPGGGGK